MRSVMYTTVLLSVVLNQVLSTSFQGTFENGNLLLVMKFDGKNLDVSCNIPKDYSGISVKLEIDIKGIKLCRHRKPNNCGDNAIRIGVHPGSLLEAKLHLKDIVNMPSEFNAKLSFKKGPQYTSITMIATQ